MYFSFVSYLVDGATCPRPTKIRQDFFSVQIFGDFALGLTVFDESAINLADDFLLFVWARHKNHAISLETLVFANFEGPFVFPGLIDQHPPQAKSRRAALLEPELDQPAGALKYLRREFAAVFAGHRAFHALDDV
ncbi:MAG: hypothetical protein Q7S40_33605 [Opitutaceae bacterium]|nr:hypothetical protein [Opitutaceae bacterium]